MKKRKAYGVTSSDQRTVLVTGGSGYIGRSLVKNLADQNHVVITMYRHRLPEPMKNVYPVCTDLDSSDLLKAPLREVDSVIYLAWERPDVNEGPLDLTALKSGASENLKRLSNMIRAMEDVGTQRIIFVSASGAEKHAESFFLAEKYEAERLVINSKVPYRYIVRPTIVFGGSTDDRFLNTIMNITKFPAVYPVPKYSPKLAPINLNDLCGTLSNLVNDDYSVRVGVIDVLGGESISIEDLFKKVALKQGKGTKLQIRGSLGSSLLRFYEKTAADTFGQYTLKNFLELGHAPNDIVRETNPMLKALPKTYQDISKALK